MPCLTMVKPSLARLHPLRVVGIVLRVVRLEGRRTRAVVDPHPVAHLAAEQLVDRHPRRLAGDVPQRVLDHADRRAPRLERAALANAHHHPLDVGRVLPDQPVAEMHDERLQVGLVLLDLAVAADALVGDHPHDRVRADHGALQICDFQAEFPRCSGPFSALSPAGPLFLMNAQPRKRPAMPPARRGRAPRACVRSGDARTPPHDARSPQRRHPHRAA